MMLIYKSRICFLVSSHLQNQYGDLKERKEPNFLLIVDTCRRRKVASCLRTGHWLWVCWSQLLVRVAACCSHYNRHVTPVHCRICSMRTCHCLALVGCRWKTMWCCSRGEVWLFWSPHVKTLRSKFSTEPSLTVPLGLGNPGMRRLLSRRSDGHGDRSCARGPVTCVCRLLNCLWCFTYNTYPGSLHFPQAPLYQSLLEKCPNRGPQQ